MSRVIGIDLGTTNSVVSVWDREKQQVRILRNAGGTRTTPSVVGFPDRGAPVVGDPARGQQVTNPEQTVYSIKRFMGRRHSEVQSEEKIVPYQVVGKPQEFVKVRAGKRLYTPQEISAMILRDLRTSAEQALGEPVDRAVITVPAYFNDSQRLATKEAGKIAGLTVERIINEPTAAALAYGREKQDDRRIVVFDFGGGTFDLSVLLIGRGTFEVVAVHGNTHLGGDDFDQRIIDIVADDYRRRERMDLRNDPMALQRLKQAAEEAKVLLSTQEAANIMLPFIAVDGAGPRHLQYTLERSTFEALCTDLFEDLRECCQHLLRDAGLKGREVTDVVMVGGSTRIPRVQAIAREVFETDQLDKTINPDEVVAAGAGLIAAVIGGEVTNVLLQDVTSQELGVETLRGQRATLVPRNTPLPACVKKEFTTPRTNQTSVPIHIVEGDAKRAADCRTLGEFQLTGIRKAKRGEPRIEVSFDIDANGILQVTATDLDTKRSQNVTCTGGIGLDKAELERMKNDLDMHSEQDEKRKVAVDLRNHAESIEYDVRRWIEFNRTVMNPRAIDQVETALRKLRKKIAAEDNVGIKAALKKLDSICRPLRKTG